MSIEDKQWKRCDIKTVQLLYPSMGKMMAQKAGVDDAWMIADGYVTEGTSNNAYIVKDDAIITRAVSGRYWPASPGHRFEIGRRGRYIICGKDVHT